jgi:SRSO17 transposase
VSTPDDVAVAAGHRVDPTGWRELFDELMSLVAGRFWRVEPRRAAREFVLGLLSAVEHKNCWWLAEQAGHSDPQAMQRLLRTAVWDADLVRDDLRGFVAAQLGDPGGVLICDETGFLKKGTGSVGVQRQYSGTAGRIENSQVGVFLSYASPRGRALIDRRIYLPRSWAEDRARCTGAGVPAEVQFATKPELALQMITEAAAGMPASWVASDEAYGDNGAFRAGPPNWAWVMCWRSPAPTRSRSGLAANGGCGPITSPPPCPAAAGSASVPGPARRAHAGMTGPGCAPTRRAIAC